MFFVASEKLASEHPALRGVIEKCDHLLNALPLDGVLTVQAVVERLPGCDDYQIGLILDELVDRKVLSRSSEVICNECGTANSQHLSECTQCGDLVDKSKTQSIYVRISNAHHLPQELCTPNDHTQFDHQKTPASRLNIGSPLLTPTKGTSMPKPRIFIGSSVEGKAIAESIQLGLHYEAECTVWWQGVFGLSIGTLEGLIKASTDYEFAVLVLTPDDLVEKRGVTKSSPRDNVLFELGFFMGALGKERTYIVYCHDDPIELPTDLAGINPATFSKRSDGNVEAAVGPVCTKIKAAINAVQKTNAK